MFRTLVDYYSKYQNSFVKHNDAVVEEEVDGKITGKVNGEVIRKDIG